MSINTQLTEQDAEASQAFFAALLNAATSQCECKTCKILKKLAQKLAAKYDEQ